MYIQGLNLENSNNKMYVTIMEECTLRLLLLTGTNISGF